MKPETILQADLLDILFENRNKEYGAYALRREYPETLQLALIFVMTCVVVVSILFNSSRVSNQFQPGKGKTIFDIDTLIIIPPPPDKPVPIPPPPPRATIDHAMPVIAEDGTDNIPTVEELARPVQIGTVNRDGDSTDLLMAVADIVDSSGSYNIPAVTEPEPAIYHSVQEMPEFPGGTNALQRFLIRNLRVPDEGLEPGTKITVQVQFIVDRAGKIAGMEILRSGGELYNKEVLRVLNKMPAWKPGRQNGMTVPVYFTLPVTFQVD